MYLTINTHTLGKFGDEELYDFCMANRNLRVERNREGQIIIMAPTGTETSFYNADILTELHLWNRATKLGKVSDSNGGFTLPNQAMRVPDVAWISLERWGKVPEEERKKFAHICPEFVIELMSSSDSLREMQPKMEEWIENGCRLAWLIEPKEGKTFVYKENGTITEIPFETSLSGENVLPGFQLKLATIFDQK